MTVNVRGRTIEIDDALAKAYENIGYGPVSGLFILTELANDYGGRSEDIFASLSDQEVARSTEHAIREYLKVFATCE